MWSKDTLEKVRERLIHRQLFNLELDKIMDIISWPFSWIPFNIFTIKIFDKDMIICKLLTVKINDEEILNEYLKAKKPSVVICMSEPIQ